MSTDPKLTEKIWSFFKTFRFGNSIFFLREQKSIFLKKKKKNKKFTRTKLSTKLTEKLL